MQNALVSIACSKAAEHMGDERSKTVPKSNDHVRDEFRLNRGKNERSYELAENSNDSKLQANPTVAFVEDPRCLSWPVVSLPPADGGRKIGNWFAAQEACPESLTPFP